MGERASAHGNAGGGRKGCQVKTLLASQWHPAPGEFRRWGMKGTAEGAEEEGLNHSIAARLFA